MSRAYTAPPPIKDEGDEEQGDAEVVPKLSVSPVKESAAEEAAAADRAPAGTPSAARRQASLFGRSKTGKAAPSPKHSRRSSQQKVCTSSRMMCKWAKRTYLQCYDTGPGVAVFASAMSIARSSLKPGCTPLLPLARQQASETT